MKEEEQIQEYLNKLRKVSEPREHKIKSSLGVYDAYKWLRKNGWKDIPRPLKEKEFYSIVRKVNEYMAEELAKGNDVRLPCKLGRLEIRKFFPYMRMENGKLKTNLPVDWDRTCKLWYEDQEARDSNTLVRIEEKEIFKVLYNRNNADFNNKAFYEFNVNREIKRALTKRIKLGNFDAFLS